MPDTTFGKPLPFLRRGPDGFLSSSPWESAVMPRPQSPLRSSLLPLVVGLAVALVTWLTAWPGFPGAPGLTWDETYYHPTFHDVSRWTAMALRDPGAALSPEGISQGWRRIDELPPVVKWIGAFFVSLPVPATGWAPLITLRAYPALALGLTTLFLILIGRRLMPGWWGVLPPAAYLLMPRVWGHGQVAATESVFALITVMTLWVALQDLQRWKWRLLLVLMCAIAMATKVNGLILVIALVGWLVFRPLFLGRLRGRASGRWRTDLLLAGALILFPPLLALLIWPWMWHDTLGRIGAYAAFIRDHAHQGLWYFGRRWNFNAPLVPPTYPLVITHLTTPLAVLAAFWLAVLAGTARLLAQRGTSGPRLLIALFVLGPLLASSLPGTPKYDGIRLFFPMFAPATLLLALGLRDITIWWRFAMGRGRGWQRRAVVLGLPALLLASDGAFRPKLDYYNALARAIGRPETIFPFEQTYWLNAFDAQAIAELNSLLPPGARIKTRGFHGDTLPLLQEWGVLEESFDVSGADPPFDAHLIQNRRGFWGNADWTIWQERAPIATWGRGPTGEGLIFLYDGRPPGSGP